eukprot:6181079-Pleurochrysis_carterae.AAC.2
MGCSGRLAPQASPALALPSRRAPPAPPLPPLASRAGDTRAPAATSASTWWPRASSALTSAGAQSLYKAVKVGVDFIAMAKSKTFRMNAHAQALRCFTSLNTDAFMTRSIHKMVHMQSANGLKAKVEEITGSLICLSAPPPHGAPKTQCAPRGSRPSRSGRHTHEVCASAA